jgi:hypothetical protein
MQLLENEIELKGAWHEEGSGVVANEVCVRIQWLVENSFKEIASLNWETVYQDINDSRFWLLTYPQSNMHGGGPPSINIITNSQVKEKLQSVEN